MTHLQMNILDFQYNRKEFAHTMFNPIANYYILVMAKRFTTKGKSWGEIVLFVCLDISLSP